MFNMLQRASSDYHMRHYLKRRGDIHSYQTQQKTETDQPKLIEKPAPVFLKKNDEQSKRLREQQEFINSFAEVTLAR